MSVRTSHRAALWLACALASAGTRASAEPAGALHVVLDYQVDPALIDCPSATDLSRLIRERLGYDPFVAEATAARHRVKASIDRAATGTEAHVEWLDAAGHSEGERRLGAEGGDCAELGRGLAFAIAVQIQLRASIEAPPPVAKLAPERPKAARPPPRSKPRTTTVTAGAGVLGQSGLTPGFRPGLRVFGSLGNARLSLELSTEAALPAERHAADETGFTASSLAGKIAPCAHVSIVGFCGLGMLGQLSVRGQGVDRIESPSSLVGGAGARVQVLWPSRTLVGGLLHVEALVLFTPRTVLVNRQDVWSTAPVVFSAGIDLAAVFR